MIHNQTIIGYNIFYFLALIKAHTTENTIGNALPSHFILKTATLGIRAVEDGETTIVTVLFTMKVQNVLAHIGCFLFVALKLPIDDRVAYSVFTINIFGNLILVVLHQAVGCCHNVLSGTVITLKLEHSSLGILTLKMKNIVDVGSPECINTLIVIPYNT